MDILYSKTKKVAIRLISRLAKMKQKKVKKHVVETYLDLIPQHVKSFADTNSKSVQFLCFNE